MLYAVFAWLVSQPDSSIVLSYKISTSHQLPASQQYYSLITNQHQPSGTAKRTQRIELINIYYFASGNIWRSTALFVPFRR